MLRTLFVFVAIIALATVSAVWVAPPAEGQTLPPLIPYPTPAVSPTVIPSCPDAWCAPPVIVYPTPTPAVDPGDSGDGPAGPGIIAATPSPTRLLGLPNAAHLHFIALVRR